MAQTPGYFHGNFFPADYYPDDYWPEYGTAAAPVISTDIRQTLKIVPRARNFELQSRTRDLKIVPRTKNFKIEECS